MMTEDQENIVDVHHRLHSPGLVKIRRGDQYFVHVRALTAKDQHQTHGVLVEMWIPQEQRQLSGILVLPRMLWIEPLRNPPVFVIRLRDHCEIATVTSLTFYFSSSPSIV
jgi:hypothetical protein